MSGFFIQQSTYPGDYISQLNHIARRHLDIDEVVICDADYSTLAVNLPPHFDKFVGAPNTPWLGPRADTPTDLQSWMLPISGVAGMLTPSYRWDQLTLDVSLARALLPGTSWDFYVGQEVGIDALGDHPRLRLAWEAYLVELCQRLYSIRLDINVLWSPYAWELWSTVSVTRRGKVQAAVLTLLRNVRTYSGTRGITHIDLQDGQGAQPSEPETDAANWYSLIALDPLVSFRINMEYFTPTYLPQPPQEMDRRAAFYKSKNIPIGNCWELRYW